MPDPAPWQRRLPNQLTAARVVLAAVFFSALAPYQHSLDSWRGSRLLPALAGILFILAAITDAFDGHLARKWSVVSVFGRVMDPFADKILVLGAFVLLAGPGFLDYHHLLFDARSDQPVSPHALSVSGIAPWMVVVILARELLVTSLRGLIESRGADFSASPSGKIKMVVQSVAIPLILLLVSLHHSELVVTPTGHRRALADLSLWTPIVGWLVTIVTVWSAIPYVTRAIRVLSAPRHNA